MQDAPLSERRFWPAAWTHRRWRPSAPARTRDKPRPAWALAYVLGYVALDWLSYVQPVLKLGITPWNPQAGLTIAVLLWRGPGWAVFTFAAAFVSELLVHLTSARWSLMLASSALIAVAYGSMAAWLRRRSGASALADPAIMTRLLAGAAITTLLVAALYVQCYASGGLLAPGQVWDAAARYWVGDLNGVLTLAPLLLLAPRWRDGIRALAGRWPEAGAQMAALAATLWVIFGLMPDNALRFFYPLFVPATWIVLRWGTGGAAVAALTIQMGLVFGTTANDQSAPLLDVQFLMLTLGATMLLLGSVVDERARALRAVAIRESEQRALLATAPDAVLTLAPDGRVRSANGAALQMFGIDSAGMAGLHLQRLLRDANLDMPGGRANLEGCRRDGAAFPAEAAWVGLEPPATPGWLLIVRDASERRRAEAQLRERDTALARSLQFAVAGEMTSAMAHELNQPITALVSYLRAIEILAQPLQAQDERLPSTVGKAVKEAIRAADVMRRLRDFYGGGALRAQDVEIHGLLRSVAESFLERARDLPIALRVAPSSGPHRVRGDRGQLEIVLHNLVTNAMDALEAVDGPGRVVALRSDHRGDLVEIHIEDSGAGVDAELRDTLFEPFTTTKPDGMGLGLAISHTLVRAHGGELVCDRSPTLGGARFRVTLPAGAPQ